MSYVLTVDPENVVVALNAMQGHVERLHSGFTERLNALELADVRGHAADPDMAALLRRAVGEMEKLLDGLDDAISLFELEEIAVDG